MTSRKEGVLPTWFYLSGPLIVGSVSGRAHLAQISIIPRSILELGLQEKDKELILHMTEHFQD